jgi:hypothetical protein
MTDVTRILLAIEHGNPAAAGQLLPMVYDVSLQTQFRVFGLGTSLTGASLDSSSARSGRNFT